MTTWPRLRRVREVDRAALQGPYARERAEDLEGVLRRESEREDEKDVCRVIHGVKGKSWSEDERKTHKRMKDMRDEIKVEEEKTKNHEVHFFPRHKYLANM